MKVKNNPQKLKKQDPLPKSQWDTFSELGYLKLGPCLNRKELSNLSNQINRIMLGEAKIDYSSVQRFTEMMLLIPVFGLFL